MKKLLIAASCLSLVLPAMVSAQDNPDRASRTPQGQVRPSRPSGGQARPGGDGGGNFVPRRQRLAAGRAIRAGRARTGRRRNTVRRDPVRGMANTGQHLNTA